MHQASTVGAHWPYIICRSSGCEIQGHFPPRNARGKSETRQPNVFFNCGRYRTHHASSKGVQQYVTRRDFPDWGNDAIQPKRTAHSISFRQGQIMRRKAASSNAVGRGATLLPEPYRQILLRTDLDGPRGRDSSGYNYADRLLHHPNPKTHRLRKGRDPNRWLLVKRPLDMANWCEIFRR